MARSRGRTDFTPTPRNNERRNQDDRIEGRVYYGCCEMCKARLGSDPSSRVAVDPVSQRNVDKATAMIGTTDSGQALYFESEQTFAAYAGRPAR